MPERRPASLRARLLALLLGSVAAIWIGAAAWSYFDAQHEIDELLDAHLAQTAALLAAQAAEESDELEHEPIELHSASHHYSRRVAFQVWERGMTLRLRSANAPSARLAGREEGFSDVDLGKRAWRVFSAWDRKREVLVQVAEERRSRDDIAGAIVKSMLSPIAFGLPLLGILIWLAVNASLASLRRMSDEISRRPPERLTPLDAAGAPAEIVPLVENLNALFERVARSIEAERRFTADAAHELRTPLAALKAQAQVARAATADAQRSHALDQLVAGCDRTARLVEQLLTLARLEPGVIEPSFVACDLASIAREQLAEIAPQALARGVAVELESGAGHGTISGEPELLRVLVRNLVDNAVRYSPPSSSVAVAVGAASGEADLSITDSGPGVAAAERSRLGERFFRILGTGESGSGLGLSIVRRIAEMHGAHIEFSGGPGGKGLRVRVGFPAARQ